MLESWQRAVSCKGGIAGGQDDQIEDSAGHLGNAFGGEEITEFVTEEQYLADKGTEATI